MKGDRALRKLFYRLPQGHHVARVHRSPVGGGERKPAAGRPEGDRVLGVQAAALAGARGRSEARGRGSPAPRTQTAADLRPAGELSLLFGRLSAAPSAGAAGRGRLSACSQLCPPRAQGKEWLMACVGLSVGFAP